MSITKDSLQKGFTEIICGDTVLLFNKNEIKYSSYEKYCDLYRDWLNKISILDFDRRLGQITDEYDAKPSNSMLIHRVVSIREDLRERPIPAAPLYDIMALFFLMPDETDFDQNTHAKKVELLKKNVSIDAVSFFFQEYASPSRILYQIFQS